MLPLLLLGYCKASIADVPLPNPPKTQVLSPGTVTQPLAASSSQLTDINVVAATKVSFAINNGAMMDFIPAIGNALSPKSITVEVRHNITFHVSLTATDMPVEDILRGLAGFAHCNLYVLPDHFLICPPAQLKPAEKALLARKALAQGVGKGEALKPQQ